VFPDSTLLPNDLTLEVDNSMQSPLGNVDLHAASNGLTNRLLENFQA
jgi:hypothetical protein